MKTALLVLLGLTFSLSTVAMEDWGQWDATVAEYADGLDQESFQPVTTWHQCRYYGVDDRGFTRTDLGWRRKSYRDAHDSALNECRFKRLRNCYVSHCYEF